MLRADQTNPVLGKKTLLIEALAKLRQEPDRQIRLTVFQKLRRLLVDTQGLQGNVWCRNPGMRLDLRQKRDVRHIRHTNAESTFRGGRIELRIPMRDASQRTQRLARRSNQRLGDRCGLHAGRGTHEQRIVELLSQTTQPDADRRLRHVQLLGCPRHSVGIV